jgi:hypothetical protein
VIDVDLRGKDYFTVEEAAHYCGLSVSAFRAEAEKIKLTAGKALTTRNRLYRRIDLQRAMELWRFAAGPWARQAVRDARKRAKKTAIPFTIDAAWVLRRLEQQSYRCALSRLEFSARRTRLASHKRPFMPSLDRVDCSKGYTKRNVRILCVAINTLLQDWGDEVFHEIIRAAKCSP